MSLKLRDSALKTLKRYLAISINEAGAFSNAKIEGYVKLLEEQWAKFIEAQDAVEESCGSELIATEEQSRSQAEEWYVEALSNFKQAFKQTASPVADNSATAAQVIETPTSVTPAVRLPRIELPKFSGDSTGWILFHDSFKALVHNNATLSGYQKLHYLRSCLQGEALQVVSNLTISDANYNVAWNLLCSKYKVLRIIVESHFRAIFNIKPVVNETAQSLKQVLNAMLQNIQALRALDRPVELWDDWVVYYLLSKLPYETRRQWELSLTNDKLPTLADLQTFLESRCRSLEVLAPSSTGSGSKKVSNATTLHVADSSHRRAARNSRVDPCIHCSSHHRIYACSSFRELSPNARAQIIKQKSACFNCLRLDHKVSNCKSTSNCLRCGRRHHTLLHGSADDKANVSYTSTAPSADALSHGHTSLATSPASQSHLAINSSHPTIEQHRYNFSAITAQRPAVDLPRDSTMNHISQNPAKHPQGVDEWGPEASSLNLTSNDGDIDNPILLATAIVNVLDYAGRWHKLRALFDNGSHASFVTERCVQRLGMARKSSATLITGIGSTPSGKPKGEVLLTIASSKLQPTYVINALVLSRITNDLPITQVRVTNWQHINGLLLADPHFTTPGPIDILIGMDEMEHFLTTDLRKGDPGTPLAQRTIFGWVLFGRTSSTAIGPNVHSHVSSLHCDIDLARVLSKVWELDHVTQRRHLTDAEQLCEDLFDSTHQRAKDGRFIVQLPLNPKVPLGETRSTALRSFYRLEKRLSANENLRHRYVEFMHELLQMGHMEIVHNRPTACYYMPHHAVLKEASETTKLRVVFNASLKSSSGFSLNDALLVGPQLQPELFFILLRFRMHRYAMTADIAKMYRQVYVHEKYLDYQRIVWRDAPTEELKDYRMLRLTYGTASASHLAVKALQQIGKNNMSKFQVSAKVILNDFYMDDLLTGADTADELVLRQTEVSQLLSQGGFELRKWASNCQQLLDNIPTSATTLKYLLAEKGEVKTLGLTWNTLYDCLTYDVSLKAPPATLTKRTFLSDASTMFDPLGLVSPCTIRARIWLQQIWRADVDWDEPVPEQISKDWHLHRQELLLFSNLQLSRWLGMSQDTSTEFHVFSDASEKAYAAVVYARTQYADGKVIVSLVASKAKVAPLKSTTLPRLELCAAHLAAKLSKQIIDSCGQSKIRVFAWTDSTVTLAWLKSHPSRWSTFVANRVAEVQEILPPECWSHVRSENNPADCASRGMSPSCLLSHNLWWCGPPYLSSFDYMQQERDQLDHSTQLELRKRIATVSVAEPLHQWSLLERYSSFAKLKRVMAYAMRFITNIRSRSKAQPRMQVGGLTYNEIREAELKLIRYTQTFYFSNEMSICSAKKPLPRRSTLFRLNPFIDVNGVLRVGGRINHSNVTMDVKHPIILGKNSTLAKLIILDIHKFTLHAGPRIMQVVLQRRFWVIGARNLIRNMYHKCVQCTCINRNVSTQSMADLPEVRVTYARPFTCTAVDFAGPYLYKFTHGRGAKSIKGYICSFVCMSTGAMHLELVGDLSAPAFLNCFKRFINRRGYCKHMYSDNGTNFVGAEKEIQSSLQQCMEDDKSRSLFNELCIEWHFNPPSAPHMGGYWEIGVKRIKYHLKRTLGDTLLSYEEFNTLLTEVEACVNSRPICDNSADVNDVEALTPGHFLVGEPLKALPEPETQTFRGNLYRRWQVISAMRQHFWRRWRDEYLVNLQRRYKWFRPSCNIEEGDIVAVYDKPTPPTKWSLARVLKCHPGSDGLVRVVTIKTSEGEYVRPIVKLCRLPTKGDVFSEEDH